MAEGRSEIWDWLYRTCEHERNDGMIYATDCHTATNHNWRWLSIDHRLANNASDSTCQKPTA